mgnify:CR=1 FL=1
MTAIPSHPDSITPAWLTERLRASGLMGQGAVTAVKWEPIGTGQVGDSVRFHLTFDQAGIGPVTLAGKFPAADQTSRGTAAAFGLYAKEVGFYRELRHHLGVRVPSTIVADIARDPHYQARGMIEQIELDDGTRLDVPGIIPKLSRTPGSHRRNAPTIGQDTDAVLHEIGLTPQQIQALKDKGVVA